MPHNPSPPPVRVFIIDAPLLHRRFLVNFLNRRRGILVVGEVGTGRQAVEQVQSLHPDVVVLDPEAPESGPQLVSAIAQVSAGTAILALARTSADGNAGRILQAGARGYLGRECEPEDVVRGIERVYAGELVVAPVAADAVRGYIGRPHRMHRGSLTGRELQVLRLVAEGRTNAAIARELCITEYTAKGHLAKILHKVGLDNRVQLATYAMNQGLFGMPASSSA